jgi:pteridine reductase
MSGEVRDHRTVLTGKVVLVTGGAKRVGRAIALACAAAGADIAVHYRNSRTEAEQLVGTVRAQGQSAAAFGADLTSSVECAALRDDVLAEFGGLDVLINNAASFEHAPMVGGDDARWERAWTVSLETNLVAPARLARLFADSLRARSGAIINLIDIAGSLSWPGYLAHGSSKAALSHLTKGLAVVLGPEVRVNGIAPGIAVFPDSMSQAERDALVAKTTLERAGNAEQVAELVAFVCSHDYISGAVIPVDGGWSVPR